MSDSTEIQETESASYLGEFTERHSQGLISPLDRANVAVQRAAQAVAVFSEADDCDKAENASRFERVVQAASACGIATRRGEDNLAAQFARVAESEAITLDSYDSAKLQGLKRPAVFSEVA